MKRKLFPLLLVAGIFMLWGCYPDGPDYAEEMDIVLTSHNQDYDFAGKATYAMPDKIVKITGNVTEGEQVEFIPDAAAASILGMIKDNMSDLGWTKVDVSANPDLLLLPAAWETTTVYYWYDYWYDWWYYDWYPYWPYYPPVYYSSYSTGTLLTTFIDPDELQTDGAPVKQWVGAVSGLLTGSYDANRVKKAIDKMFAISPYLKTN